MCAGAVRVGLVDGQFCINPDRKMVRKKNLVALKLVIILLCIININFGNTVSLILNMFALTVSLSAQFEQDEYHCGSYSRQNRSVQCVRSYLAIAAS